MSSSAEGFGDPVVAHTGSWYAASLPAHLNRLRDPLDGDTVCDVCIVGGGFAGVSAAYHLAKAGQRVVLLEASRIGWGASGRNGGQIHPGYRKELAWFERTMSLSVAQRVKQAADIALGHLDGLIAEHVIPCERTHGLITACRTASDFDEEVRGAEEAHRRFGVEALEVLAGPQTAAALGTGGHKGGLVDHNGGHLHPLAFVTALADAAEAFGAQLYDQTPVVRVDNGDQRVQAVTSHGTVTADHLVLCGNGMMKGLHTEMDARVMPITNFIVATEPMGAGQPGGLLHGGEAAADTRFVVRYWRPTPDGRLLFGGGEKFSRAFPKDIEVFVRPYLTQMYPQLEHARIDYAWGGTLAVTQSRLPLIRKLEDRITVAAGFSGQGVVNAPFAGKVIADALTHDPALLDLISTFPCPRFPGGAALRGPLLFLAMSTFALLDRIG